MSLEKQPFTRYNEEDNPRDLVTVSLNKKERAVLDHIKQDLNIKADSKALKAGMIIGRNAIHRLFGKVLLRYLFKKERVKLSDYEDFE